MKLLKMKNQQGELDYMVKFEDSYEDSMYDETDDDSKDYVERWNDFNTWLDDNLGVIDSDVCTYLMSSEDEPEVGETFELDDIKWERVA